MSAPPEAANGDATTAAWSDDRLRIEVVRGGPLDDAQAAALAVAIASRAGAGADSGPGPADHAWARAARVEGIGRPRIARPSDLDQAG